MLLRISCKSTVVLIYMYSFRAKSTHYIHLKASHILHIYTDEIIHAYIHCISYLSVCLCGCMYLL